VEVGFETRLKHQVTLTAFEISACRGAPSGRISKHGLAEFAHWVLCRRAGVSASVGNRYAVRGVGESPAKQAAGALSDARAGVGASVAADKLAGDFSKGMGGLGGVGGRPAAGYVLAQR
jgi:hypothetical protein